MTDNPDQPIMDGLEQIEGQHAVLDRLTREIATGQVKCVMVQILYEDDSSFITNSGGKLVEQVGLLETMKFDLLHSANRAFREFESDNHE